jgi:hypothetical protein
VYIVAIEESALVPAVVLSFFKHSFNDCRNPLGGIGDRKKKKKDKARMTR